MELEFGFDAGPSSWPFIPLACSLVLVISSFRSWEWGNAAASHIIKQVHSPATVRENNQAREAVDL